MSEIDWSKAPEGYPIWIEDLAPSAGFDGSGWHRDDGDRYTDEGNEYWLKPEEGYYRIHERPSPAWSGEGLPPVGVVCEYCCVNDQWRQVKVIAHMIEMQKDNPCAVSQLGDTGPLCIGGASSFRPIRTPEQIEADEREAAIRSMLSGFDSAKSWLVSDLAGFIYDKGFRKP